MYTRTLWAITLFATTAFADVISVTTPGGGGDFTSVQQALLAAQDGDTVIVRGSGLVSFNEVAAIAGRSVSLIAEEGVTARLEFLQIRNLPADGTVVVRGIELRGPFFDAVPTPLEITDCLGHVRLEEVTSRGKNGVSVGATTFGADGSPAVLVVDSADVVFHRCEFTGGGGGAILDEDDDFAPTNGAPALVAERSSLVVSASTLTGGAGGFIDDTTTDDGAGGGPALRVTDSDVQAFGAALHGGVGGSADCDFVSGFCGSGGPGGDGVVAAGVGRVVLRDTEALGGEGGSAGGMGGTNGKRGERVVLDAGVTLTKFPSAMPFFEASRLVDTPGSLTLSITTDMPATLILWVGLDAASLDLPAFEGVLMSDTPLVDAVVLAVGPVEGVTPLTFDVPALPAGLDALTIFPQMLLNGHGPATLSAGSAVTLLSSAP